MSDIKILPVSANDLITRWTIIEPLFAKAMPVILRRYLPLDVLVMCITNQAQGWLVFEKEEILAVIITQINQYPRRRALNIFLLSGRRMADFFPKAEEILIEYARRLGADHFECAGRKGWERVLDLEPHSTLLVRDIDPVPVIPPDMASTMLGDEKINKGLRN